MATLLGLSACSWGVAEEQVWRELELEVVRIYGSSEEHPTGTDFQGVGWVGLGIPQEVTVGSDGAVFVVDRAWRQVVGFNPDGSLRSIIRPTQGQGPGEFEVPNSIALTPRGDVAVLDTAGNRIQVFSPDGTLLDYLPLAVGATIYGFMIDPAEDIWVIPAMGEGRRSSAFRLDPRGIRVEEEVFPATARDREYGGSGGLALGADGAVLLAHRQPGTWTEWDPIQGYRRAGSEVYPGVQRLAMADGPSATFRPTWSLGIGRSSDGRTLIPFTAYESFLSEGEISLGESGTRHFVAVFDRNSDPLGIAKMPDMVPSLGEVRWGTRNAHVSRHTGHLYSVAFSGAEVVVVELRVLP